MKRTIWTTGRTMLLAALLALGVAACDSQSANDEEAEILENDAAEFASSVTQELGLSSGQEQNLLGAMNRRGGRVDPGFLWMVAADLQASLSDEQKARLFALADSARARVDGNGECRARGDGPRGDGPRGNSGLGLKLIEDLLTDEQQAALETLRTSFREESKALVEAHRNGDITREELAAQLQQLGEAFRAEVDALLTDEQKAELERRLEERMAEREAEREARRTAEREAMIAALGLTDAQLAALDALREDQSAARAMLAEQFAAGDISCEELREAVAALHDAAQETLQTILDATQWEIWRIHAALSRVFKKADGPRRQGDGPRAGGPGGARPPGGGPPGGRTGG